MRDAYLRSVHRRRCIVSTATKKERWSWKRWHERLDASPLSDEHKALVRRLHVACKEDGRTRSWQPFWRLDTIEGKPFQGDLRPALSEAQKYRLVIRCFGGDDWLPVLGPPLPASESIRLKPTEARMLLTLLDGWRGARIVKPGWCTKRDDMKTRWMLWTWEKSYHRITPAAQRAIDSLYERDLIEADGTISGGWRDPSVYFYRPVRHLLYAVANRKVRETVAKKGGAS